MKENTFNVLKTQEIWLLLTRICYFPIIDPLNTDFCYKYESDRTVFPFYLTNHSGNTVILQLINLTKLKPKKTDLTISSARCSKQHQTFGDYDLIVLVRREQFNIPWVSTPKWLSKSGETWLHNINETKHTLTCPINPAVEGCSALRCLTSY